jgi:hypothetical protein
MTIDRKHGRELMRLRHTFRNSMTGRMAPAHPGLAAIVLLDDRHFHRCSSRRHQTVDIEQITTVFD